ncbi:MAG TPA: hypothetical protein VFB02_22715 [Bradyrhizobium sp.]|nr:hypothetical protein [Bradyrhizobium sp.]
MRHIFAAKLMEMERQSFGGTTPVAGTFLPPCETGATIRVAKPAQQQAQSSLRRMPPATRRRSPQAK